MEGMDSDSSSRGNHGRKGKTFQSSPINEFSLVGVVEGREERTD